MRPLLKSSKNYFGRTNYYQVLGLPRNSSLEEIQRAFREKLNEVEFRMGERQSEEKRGQVSKIFEAFGVLSNEFDKLKNDREDFSSSSVENLEEVKNLDFQKQEKERVEQVQKDFNLNDSGRYNGGHPNIGNYNRGSALGIPGQIHSKYKELDITGEDFSLDFQVLEEDTQQFATYKRDDKNIVERQKTWSKVKVITDPSSKFLNPLYLKIIVALVGSAMALTTGSLLFDFKRQYLTNNALTQDNQLSLIEK